VPDELPATLCGKVIRSVERRSKYLMLRCQTGTLILHLGMSGSLRIVPVTQSPCKHDHVDIVFADGRCLRYTDPRRFGALLWSASDPLQHPLLASIGPEPLTASLSGDYLYDRSRGRRVSIKQFIMDGRIVCGVGNIYANEALFMAGIHPSLPAGRISRKRYQRLVAAIKKTLKTAIAAGGTTLRDFLDASGNPGYFQLELKVYGRDTEHCLVCGRSIRSIRYGQRSTFYCPRCQR
jgi:formamidopyrimidine-DNA glycosylase